MDDSSKIRAEDKIFKIRHSLAHVMAQAVLQIRPNSKLAFGPPIENGFYYDFDLDQPLTPEDLPEIESRMRKIIGQKQEFKQFNRTVSEAVAELQKRGENYKVEYAEELASKGETELGFYVNGPFEDMCRGPHVKHTGELPADSFAIESIAGAYWRGDEKRPQLTRIYAVAFENKKLLAEYQERRKLARERDHRKLGTELEIFAIEEQVGPGLILWLPNGTVLRDQLEAFAKEIEFKAGYVRVATPHIAKSNLYYTSGHLPYYKDSMFPPMQLDGDQEYYLKAMNCPHHHLIFRNRPRSYREMPMRVAEYGTCYRYEDSGSLAGLLRVRCLNMNDAHIYCRPDQLHSEFRDVLDMHTAYYKKFRLSDYWMRLSFWDPNKKEKYIDNADAWASSEKTIKEVVDSTGEKYSIGIGEAAFYGPKVDFQIRNVVGREETASTNQLDFAGAERFDLSFIGEDGKHHRPYIIHRAPLGTHERFLAFLIEHFGGAFPTWMAPVQVKIIPVADKFPEYVDRLQRELHEMMIRVEVDHTSETFNKKIRNAVTKKIPNILVVGGREAENEEVTWRRYCVKEQRSVKFGEFKAILAGMLRERTMDNFADEILPQ